MEFYDPKTVALDIQFNAAVMAIANRVCPSGWLVGSGAPQSYEELVARLGAGKAMFVDECEPGIYGCPEVASAFKAWKFWCHWKGRHDFSDAGNFAVYKMQCEHLEKIFGKSDVTA